MKAAFIFLLSLSVALAAMPKSEREITMTKHFDKDFMPRMFHLLFILLFNFFKHFLLI